MLPVTPDRDAPKDALTAFDVDRAAGLDAQEAIERLGERLGVPLEDKEEELSSGDSVASVMPGLIAEYLWDVARVEGAAEAARHASIEAALSPLGDVDVIEELSARRLLLLGCTHLNEDRALSADQRRIAAESIHTFCAWCSEHHGLELDAELRPAFESLPESLGRLSSANETTRGDEPSGEWCEVQLADGELVVQDPEGALRPLQLDLAAIECLKPGDYVRGEFAGEGFAVRWCYPPELAAAR